MDEEFSDQEGDTLLRLARMTIGEKLGVRADENDIALLEKELEAGVFKKKRGVFVTLQMNGELRGCIGNLEAGETVAEAVRENSVNAAFKDPRFPALQRHELERVSIEISILTKPEPVKYRDKNDLLSKITPNKDGVIIGDNRKKATFLPQVWEQVPGKEEFLSHLCVKAGMRKNEWKNGGLEVKVYRVESFQEKTGNFGTDF